MPQSDPNKYAQLEDEHDPKSENPKTGDVAPQQTVTIALPPQDAATPVPEPGHSDRSEFDVCTNGFRQDSGTDVFSHAPGICIILTVFVCRIC